MRKIYFQNIVFASLTFLSTLTLAERPTWNIVPSESSLRFTAIQNGAPITGQFKIFAGEIKGDPAQLDTLSIKIIVDLNSISDAYNQLADTLKSPEWFNIKLYPQAVFQSSQFTKTGDKTYEVKGNLTIRDKSLPIILTFSQEEVTATKEKVKGNTTIKRKDFNVGTGEWADTSAIKNEVQVDFTLTALKQ